jgi:hypothetical protein
MKDKELFLEEHIAELRKRIIWTLIVFILSMVLGLFVSTPLIELLKNDPAADNIPWNVFGLTDALSVYLLMQNSCDKRLFDNCVNYGENDLFSSKYAGNQSICSFKTINKN